MAEFKKGLEDVVALETSIASIDGINGVLTYRGIDINDLAKLSYDAVSYLLLNGELPDENPLSEYSGMLAEQRPVDEGILSVIRICNFNIEAMDALRTTVSYMSHCDPDLNDNSTEVNSRRSQEMRVGTKRGSMLS